MASEILNSFSIKSRSFLEIVIEFSAIFFYIWRLTGHTAAWKEGVFFWFVLVGFPMTCIYLEQKDFPEFSLDWEDFIRCIRIVLWFTVFGTVFLVSIALYFKSFSNGSDHGSFIPTFTSRIVEYFFWAFLQQIGLQIFLTRRVQRVFSNPYLVALISSTIFASIHFPNPPLLLFTWVGGFFWVLSFLRAPNLYALACSHGWLAVLALYCVPHEWLHQLKIGPTYWG